MQLVRIDTEMLNKLKPFYFLPSGKGSNGFKFYEHEMRRVNKNKLAYGVNVNEAYLAINTLTGVKKIKAGYWLLVQNKQILTCLQIKEIKELKTINL